MDGENSEFHDWEVLHNSDTAGLLNLPDSSDNVPINFDGIDGDSGGMIRSDYFSLDNQGRVAAAVVSEEVSDSVESDNPSWIDPAPDTRFGSINPGEPWSDSGSDRSDDRKLTEFDAKKELDFLENAKSQVGFEGIGEIQTLSKETREFWSDTGGDDGIPPKGTGMSVGDSATELEGEGAAANESGAIDEMKPEDKSNDGKVEKRAVAWWKVPFEVLKYCAFRVSPVWTFSVAAAMLGIVMLGRRLYKMKRKSRSLQLKVTMDDKVSQFMSRAARLNEAFSVVRRVPIIRPSLPATGVAPWPVMSLR
ncbi:uncharacterized protein LOC133777518 isoform X2 [Humulus lupulus]|uniref:uncharacterized protein LOC133777518 isoform X2 n=1 Tax=Humulus lupulus TaxID=3486 RepID=UPI002B40BF84|nr:uncharacterized protein LOC133777518 isoform X2 [Humulus lupulus]